MHSERLWKGLLKHLHYGVTLKTRDYLRLQCMCHTQIDIWDVESSVACEVLKFCCRKLMIRVLLCHRLCMCILD